MIIFVDPGHGGRDPGAIGPSGSLEKDINLAIALHLREALEAQGYSVVLSRERDIALGTTLDADLYARYTAANSCGAALLLSIHCNAASATATGSEVWYRRTAPLPDEGALAAFFSYRLAEELGIANRGAKQEDFAVCYRSACSALLVECAFLSNPKEERLLVDPLVQQRVGQNLATGISSLFPTVPNLSLVQPTKPRLPLLGGSSQRAV
ncbi:MAG: N-acetylmuramoyl-L-alanine amidase [Symbiobacteriaceae bacterium]|nr:N-acetylmuramoyl-L-alanine amidase [Symbiobacteriaceae bacterium]